MRKRGKVKWYNHDKGFGFIRPDEGGDDCFVHHADIHGSGKDLNPNDEVAYDLVTHQRGPRAVNVTKIQG